MCFRPLFFFFTWDIHHLLAAGHSYPLFTWSISSHRDCSIHKQTRRFPLSLSLLMRSGLALRLLGVLFLFVTLSEAFIPVRTVGEYRQNVIMSRRPVLVFFTTSWCGEPCNDLRKMVEKEVGHFRIEIYWKELEIFWENTRFLGPLSPQRHSCPGGHRPAGHNCPSQHGVQCPGSCTLQKWKESQSSDQIHRRVWCQVFLRFSCLK